MNPMGRVSVRPYLAGVCRVRRKHRQPMPYHRILLLPKPSLAKPNSNPAGRAPHKIYYIKSILGFVLWRPRLHGRCMCHVASCMRYVACSAVRCIPRAVLHVAYHVPRVACCMPHAVLPVERITSSYGCACTAISAIISLRVAWSCWRSCAKPTSLRPIGADALSPGAGVAKSAAPTGICCAGISVGAITPVGRLPCAWFHTHMRMPCRRCSSRLCLMW